MLKSVCKKVAGLNTCIIIKKKLQHRCFLVNIAKILKIPFYYKTHPVAASGKHIEIKLLTYILFVTFQCLHCKLLKTIFQQGLQDFSLKPSFWVSLPIESFRKVLLCLLSTPKLSQETRSSGVKIGVAMS